jgi:hypothetical protein
MSSYKGVSSGQKRQGRLKAPQSTRHRTLTPFPDVNRVDILIITILFGGHCYAACAPLRVRVLTESQ